MTDEQIQDIADRTISALEGMSPGTNWPVLITAIVAFLIGLATIWQKKRADARAEWWRRAQWALESISSSLGKTDEASTQRYTYGVKVLQVLAKSKLAGKDEKAIFDSVYDDEANQLDGESHTAEVEEMMQALSESLRKFGLDDPLADEDNGSKEDSHGQ